MVVPRPPAFIVSRRMSYVGLLVWSAVVFGPDFLPRLVPVKSLRTTIALADSPQETYEKRRDLALQLVQLLNEKRFTEATERFDVALRQALPPNKLAAFWPSAESLGKPWRGRDWDYERFGKVQLLRVDRRWESSVLTMRLAFDRENRICGFWLDANEERPLPAGFPKGGYQFGAAIQEAVKADLSLEGKVLGPDGQPATKSSVLYWIAIDDEAEQDAQCWHDPVTGKVWRRIENRRLAPGVYRMEVWLDQGRSAPGGMSDPIVLDGKQKHTVVTYRAPTGPALVLRPMDAATGKPVPELRVTVTCKTGQMPPDTWITPTEHGGLMKIERLPPGTYTIKAWRSASRPDELEYRLEKGPVDVEMVAGKDREVTLAMRGERLKEEEIAKRWPWGVTGRVTDDRGQPIEGATVSAHCGLGTLRRTGITETGKDGRYTLRFGPGVLFFRGKASEEPVGLQAASISVSKPGFVEKSLHRQGNLTMANRLPPADYPKWGNAGGPVLPKQPVNLDFVLVQALSIDGELLDAQGKPIAERLVRISGSQLPPSSNVLRSGMTNAQGLFHFEDVPPGYAWWLAVSHEDGRREEVRTPPMTFQAAEAYQVRLRLRRDAPTGLDLLEILSLKNAKGEEVLAQVVGDDPLASPPLPPELQVKGREILTKIAEANRYWLDRAPPEVRSYRYDFKLGKEAKTYEVPEKGGVPGVVRQGISYGSILYGLTAHPETVVFRRIDVQPDKVTLAYTATKSMPVSAGNGVLGTWAGFFSRSVSQGTMIVDPKTYTLREHRSEDYQETLSDYVELRPGHCVPLRVRVASGGMEFDFRFRVYEPGLWLFASSHSQRQREPNLIAQLDDVIVNGEPGKVLHQGP